MTNTHLERQLILVKKKIMGNAMEKGVFSVTVPDNLTLRAESSVTVLWHSELSCLLLH